MKKNDLTLAEIKKIVEQCCNDIYFSYEGIECGVTSTVYNYIPTFESWCGDKIKNYSSVEDVFSDSFFNGKSLKEIITHNLAYINVA